MDPGTRTGRSGGAVPASGEGVWSFGEFRLDAGRLELSRDGAPVPLRATPARLLLHLLRHRERVVPHEELLDAVWGGTAVSPSALRSALKELRGALGDSGARQGFIETRRGVGVRFAAPAEYTPPEASLPASGGTAALREPPVAKLTPPDVASVVPRPRLFERLDAAPPAVWIGGPAGAGKTALLASYVDARRTHSAWLQLDERDGDPASFFHYAGRLGRRLGAELPRYSADSPRGLRAFTRTFFEDLFAAAPAPLTLVLDDVHEVPEDASWWQLLPELVAVVPSGARLLLASREPAPASLARARVTGALAELGWEELAATPEEVAAIGRHRGRRALSDAELAALAERCAGWMGGLILGLEGALPDAGAATREELVFDYLASEVLARTPAGEREILMAAAHAPSATPALVREVAGHVDGDRVLEEWSARGSFVARLASSGSAEPAYRLHPLLRELLRARARQELPADELRGRLRIAGAHLAERSAADDAAELFLEAEAWDSLDTLLRRHAPELRQGGRDATLHGWLARVPEAEVRVRPWLALWRGASGVATEVAGAPKDLEHAFATFEVQGDRTGAGLALAEIFEAFWREFDSLASLEDWVPALERFLEASGDLPGPARVRLESAAFRVLQAHDGEHRLLAGLRERLEASAGAASSPLASLPACLSLCATEMWRGGPAAAAPFVRRLEALDPGDPLLGVQIDMVRTMLDWGTRRGRQAAELGTRAAGIAERHGAFTLAAMTLLHAAHGWLAAGSPTQALRSIRRVRSLMGPESGFLVDANVRFVEAWIAATEGAWSEARRAVRESLRVVGGRGWHVAEAITLLLQAQIARERGELREAGEVLSRGRSLGRAMASEVLLYEAALVESDLDFEAGDRDAGERILRDALGRGRRSGQLYFLGELPPLIRRQCERALELDIEPEFARTLLRLEDEAAAA